MRTMAVAAQNSIRVGFMRGLPDENKVLPSYAMWRPRWLRADLDGLGHIQWRRDQRGTDEVSAPDSPPGGTEPAAAKDVDLTVRGGIRKAKW